jgi:hypothetical protein
MTLSLLGAPVSARPFITYTNGPSQIDSTREG